MATSRIRRALRDCGLSLVLGTLFLLFLSGQIFAGWNHFNEENRRHGVPVVTLSDYVRTGACGEAVFENWESEFLQMGIYVVLTAFLFQRGSAESRDPDAAESAAERDSPRHPPPFRRVLVRFLYAHSLSLAFLTMFLLSLLGHAICGLAAVNEDAVLHGRGLSTIWQYVGSAQFWFESLQNWQSEFLAILALVVLSIWLREKGSPQSKPLEAAHPQTGG